LIVATAWAQETNQEPAYEYHAEPELPAVEALHLDPDLDLLLRAQGYLKLGQRVEALTELRAILKRDVHNTVALSLVATTLSEMGRQREAIQLFEKLASEHDQDYVVLNNLAWLQATASEAALRNSERAVRLAREALLLAPGSYNVWSTMSEAYFRNGQYDKAYRAARQAMLLAQEQKADGPRQADYAEQLNKCREAVEAFSLIDP
jgi:Tfp pilus assembly protein PilF